VIVIVIVNMNNMNMNMLWCVGICLTHNNLKSLLDIFLFIMIYYI